MKEYNINEYIYIHITERGWEYLNNIWGSDHVKKYIEPQSIFSRSKTLLFQEGINIPSRGDKRNGGKRMGK